MVQEPGSYVFQDYVVFGVPKTFWNLVFQTVSLAVYQYWYINMIVSIGAFFLVAFLLDWSREWSRKRREAAQTAAASAGAAAQSRAQKASKGEVVAV